MAHHQFSFTATNYFSKTRFINSKIINNPERPFAGIKFIILPSGIKNKENFSKICEHYNIKITEIFPDIHSNHSNACFITLYCMMHFMEESGSTSNINLTNNNNYINGQDEVVWPIETKLLHSLPLKYKGTHIYEDRFFKKQVFRNMYEEALPEHTKGLYVKERIWEFLSAYNMITFLKYTVMKAATRGLLEDPSNLTLKFLLLAHLGRPTRYIYRSTMKVEDFDSSIIAELFDQKDYYVARYIEENVLLHMSSYQTLMASTELSGVEKNLLTADILAHAMNLFNLSIMPWVTCHKKNFNKIENFPNIFDKNKSRLRLIAENVEKLPKVDTVFLKKIQNKIYKCSNEYVRTILNEYVSVPKPISLKKKILDFVDAVKWYEYLGYAWGPAAVSAVSLAPQVARGVNAMLSENPEEMVSFVYELLSKDSQEGIFDELIRTRYEQNSVKNHQIKPKYLNFSDFENQRKINFDSQNQFQLKHGIGLSIIVILVGSGYFIKKYFF